MKKFITFFVLLFIAILPIMAQSPNLGSDFEFLNSIFVSLTTMALATYAIVEVLKLKFRPTKSYISILYAVGVGLGVALIGWSLKLGFLVGLPLYSALVYGLISTAIAAFGYDIINAIKNVYTNSQLNS